MSRNAISAVELPAQLADGVGLEGTGIELEPAGAAAATPLSVIGEDRAFYGGFAEDSDFLVAPVATGFEFMIQVRSSDSPETYQVRVGLPEGATLAGQEAINAAKVVRSGETVATVSPPVAVDAQGSSVPVEMRVAGSSLELSLRHRGADVASTDVWVGNRTDVAGGDAMGHLGNIAVARLHANGSGVRSGQSHNYVRSALIYMFDQTVPQWTSPASANRPWADDSQVRDHSLPVSARDVGVGMKHFNLWLPKETNGAEGTVMQLTHPCSGDRTYRCPQDWASSFSYRLPGGKNTLGLQAVDFTHRFSERTFVQPIDRSPPELGVTGALVDAQNQVLRNEIHGLHIAAADGSLESARTQRSGLKSIAIYVDDQLVFERTQACPGSSCRMTADWSLDASALATGEHVVAIRATDHVGQDAYEVLDINVRAPNTEIDDGPLAVIAERAATISFRSDVTSAQFECQLDTGTWMPCTSPHTFTGLADGSHTMAVRAVDSTTGTVDPSPSVRPVHVDPSYIEPEFVSLGEGMAADPDPEALDDHEWARNATFEPEPGAKMGRLGDYYPLTEKERDFCLAGHLQLCELFAGDAEKAQNLTAHLFGNRVDHTRANAFQHAYWTALMVKSAMHYDQEHPLDHPPNRVGYGFAVFHEWDDDANQYKFDLNFWPVSERRGSRMDIVNDLAGRGKVRRENFHHNEEFFCSRALARAWRAKHIGTARDPYKEASDSRRRLIFRSQNDDAGNPVNYISGRTCAPA